MQLKQYGGAAPYLKKIEPQFGSSFAYRLVEEQGASTEAAWHFHPEMEIVYIEKGNGKRHIGNHISHFSKGDLIFMGPNLPHYGFIDRLTNSNKEIVVQMLDDFLGPSFFEAPEMAHIKKLFERSKQGISFRGNIKKKVGERLTDMNYMTPFERLITILQVLDMLARSDEYKILNAETVPLQVSVSDGARINDIYKYVRTHFQEEIPLSDIANEAAMTVPAFCRYFKKHTQRTFTQFVNEYRIVHACKLLSEEYISIADLCYECGFNNFSHFNRLFKKITGKSPTQYRKELEPNIVT